MFRELCGDPTLKNVVIVTDMWGEVSPEDGQGREDQLSSNSVKSVPDKGARIALHHNTARFAHNIIRKIVENHPVVDEQEDIVDTSTREVVNRELNELIRKHQA